MNAVWSSQPLLGHRHLGYAVSIYGAVNAQSNVNVAASEH